MRDEAIRFVNTTEIASQRARLCPKDSFPMELDRELAQASFDAGWPVVELYVCRLGHSHRDWPEAAPRAERSSGPRPCAWCGLPLPPLKGGGLGSRKYHVGVCTSGASRERSQWCWHHPLETFVLERAWWYKGPLARRAPLAPLDPLGGRMPRDWADGWARVHGGEMADGAA
jgi:hypothetical protein